MPDIELRPRQVGSVGQERNRRLVRLPLAHEALDATSGCGSLTALDAAHRETVGGHEGKEGVWAPSRLPSFFRGGGVRSLVTWKGKGATTIHEDKSTRTWGHHAIGVVYGRRRADGEGEGER
jgi:hypothetical protein